MVSKDNETIFLKMTTDLKYGLREKNILQSPLRGAATALPVILPSNSNLYVLLCSG